MDSLSLDFSDFDFTSEVSIQLPKEMMWSTEANTASWTWDQGAGSSNLDTILSKIPVEPKSPLSRSTQQVTSEDCDSEGGSGSDSITQSFNSVPSASEESIGYSFNSIPASAADFHRKAPAGAANATQTSPIKEKKQKKKSNPQPLPIVPPQQVDDKDLDYKKYKTRLCRNWQQTGKCPYGEACVYAHGSKEMRGEQENEQVVNSLSKLADQMAKQMGAFVKAGVAPSPLRPLRYRKPKATAPKKKAGDAPFMAANPPMNAYPMPTFYCPPAQAWGQL